MARLVLIALGLSYPAWAGWAQTPNPSPSPWQVNAEPRSTQSIDLSPTYTNQPFGNDADYRAVTSAELLPDGTISFGMFGGKPERSTQSRATVRDFAVPRQRKAGVGFSLKF